MAQDTELITEYVNRTAIEADTAFILAQLREVQAALNKTNSVKVTLDGAKNYRQAAEGAAQLKTLTEALVSALGKLGTTQEGTAKGSRAVKDAFGQLNKEYKDAERNAANMAIQFGAQSEEALNAAKAAAELKAKLQEAKDVAKGGGKVVEFKTNLSDIEKERQALEKMGTVVSETDQAQADAAMTAAEWGRAQRAAGDDAEATAAQVSAMASAFENMDTPLQQFTGTLSENIKQNQIYKDRLKEIAAELKNLDKNSADYSEQAARLVQEQTELKLASSEVGQTINAQVKYLQAAEGSYDQLNATLGLSRNAFRQLTEEEKGSAFGQKLVADIKELDTELKAQDALIGNFQRNVGNYAGTLSPLFEKVTAELQKLKMEQKGLQDMSQRNPIGFAIGGQDRLNQVTASIQKLTQVQEVGFKTTGTQAQQVKVLDDSLKDLAQSGTQSTEFLKALRSELDRIKPVNTSTFSGAFKVLEGELAKVRERLKDPALQGAALKQLEQEEKLLAQLTENLGQTFNTSRAELRAFTEASVQMGSALGNTNESVLAFQAAVGEGIDEVNDLKATLKFQSSDTKYLEGAVSAVNGLAGAYGAAQGAAQLFGEDNEDLQRTMVKFQALLTIINGLQALQNALQTDGAAVQTLLAARTGLVNAAKALQTSLFGATTAAVEAETVAHEENAAAIIAETAAKEASAVVNIGGEAGEAAAAATDALTESQEALATAKETVAGVTEGLTTVTEVSTAVTEGNVVATNSDTAADEKSGLAKFVLAARIGLLNAARKVQAFFTAQTAAATAAEAAAAEADAIALAESAAAAQANAVAQAETAAATGAAAGALEGEAAAAGAATVATRGFGTALLATGIGAAILAIGAGIVYMVSKINDWAGSAAAALKTQNDLNDAIKDGNALINEQGNLFVKSQEGFKQYLQKQLDFSQAAGQSQVRQFAIRKKIAQEEQALAEAGVNALSVSQKEQQALLSQIESLQGQKQVAIKILREAIAKDDSAGVEGAQKVIEGFDKQLGALTPLYEGAVAARQRLTDANKNLGQLDIEQQKFEADEQRKLILETTQIQADLVKSRNDEILNSDRSSLRQRLDALRSNAEQEKKIAQAQRNDVVNNPSSSVNDIKIANERLATEIQKINRTRNINIIKENENYRLRDLQAEKQAETARLNIEIETNKEISTNQVFSLQQRMQALSKYTEDQKKELDKGLKTQLATAGFSDKEIETFVKTGKFQIENKKITTAEMLAIQTDYETGVLKLTTDTQKSVTEIFKSDLSKQKQLFDENLDDIQRSFNSIDLSVDIDYSQEVIALNESLQKRGITQEQYAKRRLAIDRKYQKETTENLIQSLEDQLSKFGDTEEKELAAKAKAEALKQELIHATTEARQTEIEKQIALADLDYKIEKALNDKKIELAKQLAAARKKLSEDGTTNTKTDTQKQLDDIAKVLEQVAALNQQITALGDALSERRIRSINDEQTALEEKHKKELSTIEQSTTSSIDKEKKIAESEARHAASKFQLDQRERAENLKKARFDKEQAIMNIILQTAVAVMRAGGITPTAIAAGIIGAVELAAAVAAPLPQYYKGKNKEDLYEGPAIVGDGNKSELIIREDGRMEVTPSYNTITYLKSKDIVLPDAKAALAKMPDVTNNTNYVRTVANNTTLKTYSVAQSYEANKTDTSYSELSKDIKAMSKNVVQAIKSQPQPTVVVQNKIKSWISSPGSWQEYLNR